MTEIYLMRHSEPFKIHKGIEDVKESLILSNIKTPLSVNGEYLADELSKKDEFQNLDVVWSSNYVRAMSTAKYFAYRNNLKVNVTDKLGERVHGISSWSELPENFEEKQFNDHNFKIGNGESLNEVKDRMYKELLYLLNTYKNKKILLVSHATALTCLLSKWCKIEFLGDYKFNNEVIFDGNWNYCETFKLVFDDNNNLLSIENLKFGEKNRIKR